MDLPVELVGLKHAGVDGFIYLGVTIFSLCLSVYFSVTNGFIPFHLPLVDALSVSFPGGRREVLLFRGLAGNFSNFSNDLDLTREYISAVNRTQLITQLWTCLLNWSD
jgi:hypothetical protein